MLKILFAKIDNTPINFKFLIVLPQMLRKDFFLLAPFSRTVDPAVETAHYFATNYCAYYQLVLYVYE